MKTVIQLMGTHYSPPPSALQSSTLKILSSSGTGLSMIVTVTNFNLSPGRKSSIPSESCHWNTMRGEKSIVSSSAHLFIITSSVHCESLTSQSSGLDAVKGVVLYPTITLPKRPWALATSRRTCPSSSLTVMWAGSNAGEISPSPGGLG